MDMYELDLYDLAHWNYAGARYESSLYAKREHEVSEEATLGLENANYTLGYVAGMATHALLSLRRGETNVALSDLEDAVEAYQAHHAMLENASKP